MGLSAVAVEGNRDWSRLSLEEGRAVLRSWRGIVEGPEPPDIVCGDARAFVQGDSGFVLCVEHLGGGELVASNLFVREAGQWKLVHHHAGPAAAATLEGGPTAVH